MPWGLPIVHLAPPPSVEDGISNHAQRLRLGKGAQQHIRDHHAPEKVAPRLASLYREILETK